MVLFILTIIFAIITWILMLSFAPKVGDFVYKFFIKPIIKIFLEERD